jgi:hypothetical protein
MNEDTERRERTRIYARLRTLMLERSWTTEEMRAASLRNFGLAHPDSLTIAQLRDLIGLIVNWTELWERCLRLNVNSRRVIAYLVALDPSLACPEGAGVVTPDLDKTAMTPDMYNAAYAWMDGLLAANDQERYDGALRIFGAEPITTDEAHEWAVRWLSAADQARPAWLMACRVVDDARRSRLFAMLRARHPAEALAPERDDAHQLEMGMDDHGE